MVEVNINAYIPIIGIISMLMLTISVLAYLASRVFRVTELEAYLNVELSEIFKSLILMSFAIGAFIVADQVALSLTQKYYPPPSPGAPSLTALSAATGIIKGTILDVQEGMSDMFSMQICLSILNTLHRRIGEFVLTVTYKLFPGIDSLIGITNVVAYALVGAMSSLTAQLFMFEIIKATMPTFFLPAGIIMRFFPPTREAGVFLISLAIGMYSVFPLVFVLNDAILHDLNKEGFKEFANFKSPTYLVPLVCGAQYSIGGASLFLAARYAFPSAISGAMKVVFSEYSINLLTMEIFLPVLVSMSYLSLPAIFLPALATSITFAFINTLTKFLLQRV